ncbi:MAG: glycosyltransferase family 2 protein [Dehalococcoidales bacterium]
MYSQPLVTCIIPTKDRHDKAIKAIKSVISQDYPKIEVVVIDDGSETPFSYDFPYEHDRDVRVIRVDKSIGGAKARNLGVKLSRGLYYCFLDDDDEYLPGKLKILVELLNEHPECHAAVGETIIFDTMTGKVFTNKVVQFSPEYNTKRNRVHMNSTLIRSSIKDKISFLGSLAKFQDTQYNTELCYKYDIVYTPTPVALWNVNWSNDQVTRVKKTFRNTANYYKLVKYFAVDMEVPPRLLHWHLFKLISFALRLK